MAKNSNLSAAKKAKNDEFYTQKADIEAELQHPDYAAHFRGKTVYLNCDDPEESEFWKFFMRVFDAWGLKKLIATHYEPNEANFSYKLEAVPDENGEFHMDTKPVKTPLLCNGDFRSAACIELLKEADIVVTNPPFSLFREYVAQLMEYDKKFLIIGSMNAITYKEFFPLLKDNQVWIGYEHPKKFMQRDGTLKAFGNIMWYTNLDIQKRHLPLNLRGNKYHDNEDKYPTYDNYDAIECSKVCDIPEDYFEHIGVPITFMEKYCPEQFEIVGLTCIVETNHQEGTVKIVQMPDGSGRIYPQSGVNLKELSEQYAEDGFAYCSGIVGVPITFLERYCPEQFDVLGFTSPVGSEFGFGPSRIYVDVQDHCPDGRVVHNNNVNTRPALLLTKCPNGRYYTARDVSGYLVNTYVRLLIRRKCEYHGAY